MHEINFPARRFGLTLIEVMIGLVMTLVILIAMMQAFKYASSEMSKGRAMIELANQLQNAQDALRRDLSNLTIDIQNVASSSTAQGYFEYIEGPCQDKTSFGVLPQGNINLFGDFDDILAFTTKSNGRLFRGRHNSNVIESNVAEIIWFTDFEERNPATNPGVIDYDEPLTLRRRLLLVRPDLGNLGPGYNFLVNDISARFENGTWIANSLEDLAKRENRFGHLQTRPFYQLARNILLGNRLISENLSGADLVFAGQDVALNDVVAFDVKVFSDDCPVYLNNDFPMVPSDYGYSVTTPVSNGAFVDLAFGLAAFQFGGPSRISYAMTNPLTGGNDLDQVYDTFSKHYESNNIDDNQNGVIDEGTNGLDDNSDLIIDDSNERETQPPYPYPTKGIKITFRVVERTTKQVRQTSLIESLNSN